MIRIKIPRDTTTTPAALPLHRAGGGRAALLLHGFTGSPHDMRFLAERLNASGYTVSVPRLPGHGTTGMDFLDTTANDWIRRAFDAYYDLAGTHASVSVCGLSMGGLLAIILASAVPVESLVLAAPALRISEPLLPLAPFIGLFWKRSPVEPDPKHADKPELERLVREYWSWKWIRPAGRLYRLQRVARRRLKDVSTPTLTVLSQIDDTVPVSTAELVRSRIGTSEYNELILEDSGHVVTNGSRREDVSDAILQWFGRLEQS